MQPWTLVAALLLTCCASVALGDVQQSAASSFATVGTINYKGSTLRVFEIDGAQVAEPRIEFRASCYTVKYSRVYMKYQLVLPIKIDANALPSARDSSKTVGRVFVTGLKVKADQGLSSREAGLSVIAKLKDSGRSANLIFLCSSFLRCRYLKEELVSNPSDIGQALTFKVVGRVGNNLVNFGVSSAANVPRVSCDRHGWIVFQRRVDGSLSFAQDWDAYVKGFGNPNTNYWMGLDLLSTLTKTSIKNSYAMTARCRLRVQTESFSGKKYSAELGMFQVLGPEQKYRLCVGLQVGSTELGRAILAHNEKRFTTFDRDHDEYGAALCSQLFGYGGWWYGACHSANLNGAYTTDRHVIDHPNYSSAWVDGKFVPMKRTLMMFKCY